VIRWLKFNAVGAIGMLVQLAMLTLFSRAAGVNYLIATALAVECAILHNFAWHMGWTWRDRSSQGRPLMRLLRFHLANGLVSIACNVAGMRLMVGTARMPLIAANLLCIAVGAGANFVAADRLVFREAR
jgi:putative flippase GtrA